ncbi:MAG: GGDEF domain-containing protein [Haliea sp.]|nr:GGDEF domain-containing protein [Haliea sp.]
MNGRNREHSNTDVTTLHDRCERLVVITMGCVAILVIAPFAVFRFESGNYQMAILDALLIFAIGITIAHNRSASNKRFSNLALLIILSLAAIVVSMKLGIVGLMWTYPLIILYFFILSIRMATFASLMLLGILIAVFYHQQNTIFDTLAERLSYLASCFMAASQAAIFSSVTHGRRRVLEYGATRDALTVALNRGAMGPELERAIAACDRHNEASCLLALDLDHFKQVNDTHGHGAGDQVLIDFVSLVKRGLRREDQLFRHGGEEFLVLLRNTDAAGMRHVEALLHQRIRSSLRCPGGPVTTSMGGAQLRRGERADQWLRRADEHLYAAKAAGRDTSVLDQSCQRNSATASVAMGKADSLAHTSA